MNLDKLNDMQKEAVVTTDGALLILAGAGSGKTTVLVNRIAYILEKKLALPYEILAITFTNKAANEMKTRIEKMNPDSAQDMWIATFHSACVRILRNVIDRVGFNKNFVIYDTDDSKVVIKECLKELNLDDKVFNPRSVASVISKAKDELISCEDFIKQNENDYRLSKIAMVYQLYQEKLLKNNALDFDDIVYFTVKILKENNDVLTTLQRRFRYIMVDEYQDTSTVQYMLISLLAGKNGNICVVGDDDQSIYKFRGANIRNILDFEKDFKDAKIIKLEQNYRSTKNILNAANAVIKNNNERKSKALWTNNSDGEKIKIYTASNEHDEARFVADTIDDAVTNGAKYSDFAILYRTNAQSRVIEDKFIKTVIPYRVLSGLRFYDRKEIKDIIAYLRVILNPDDDVSLMRIINEPKRGIGKTTMEKAAFLAGIYTKSLFEIIMEAEKYPEIARSAAKLKDFCNTINNLQKISKSVSVVDLIKRLLTDTQYISVLELENTPEAQTRIENINEFISVAAEFEKNETDTSFSAFIENITLISNIDFYDEEEDYTVMMTIHGAKGLEFKNVFVIGLEDGVFPSLKGISEHQDREDLEEERRLCYVAITRAKEKLYLSNSVQKTVFGKTTYFNQSRFINEINGEQICQLPKSRKTTFDQIFHASSSTIKPKNPAFSSSSVVTRTPKVDESACQIKKGDHVIHPKFGKGFVINAKKYGKDTLVEVAFDSVGIKQLMANFAKLTIIE